MIKETLGVAALSGALLGAPATATDQASGSTEARQEALTGKVRVKPDVAPNQTRFRVNLRDTEKDPVQGLEVCLQRREGGEWKKAPEPPPACAPTNANGRADIITNVSDLPYRIFVKKQAGFKKYTSETLDADDAENTGWQPSS